MTTINCPSGLNTANRRSPGRISTSPSLSPRTHRLPLDGSPGSPFPRHYMPSKASPAELRPASPRRSPGKSNGATLDDDPSPEDLAEIMKLELEGIEGLPEPMRKDLVLQILIRAASQGTSSRIEYILRSCPEYVQLNGADEDGMTPLMHAASFGHVRVVHLLLKYGSDIEIQDKSKIRLSSKPLTNKTFFRRLDCLNVGG